MSCSIRRRGHHCNVGPFCRGTVGFQENEDAKGTKEDKGNQDKQGQW